MMEIPKLVLTDKEKKMRADLPRAVRPRIASTIVLTCGDPKDPKILMGQRAKRHDFMPSVYVFPGGRVDRADSYAPYANDLSPRSERIMEAAYAPRKARAVVLAAIRETWEETGLMLGASTQWRKNINNSSWDDFRQANILPDLDGIEVFGRAVTPPHRHKRFDTWFFIKHIGDDTPAISDSSELLNVGWFDFKEIQDLEMQRATVMMLAVLKSYLNHDIPPRDIFHSYMKRGKFHQESFPLA